MLHSHFMDFINRSLLLARTQIWVIGMHSICLRSPSPIIDTNDMFSHSLIFLTRQLPDPLNYCLCHVVDYDFLIWIFFISLWDFNFNHLLLLQKRWQLLKYNGNVFTVASMKVMSITIVAFNLCLVLCVFQVYDSMSLSFIERIHTHLPLMTLMTPRA